MRSAIIEQRLSNNNIMRMCLLCQLKVDEWGAPDGRYYTPEQMNYYRGLPYEERCHHLRQGDTGTPTNKQVRCTRCEKIVDKEDWDRGQHQCVLLEVENHQRHPLAERFHQILAELGAVHDKKQKDYGRDNDPFANVRGSEEWGVSAWVGAMVRATDKIRRLQKFAATGQLANESVIDAFNDLAVYAVIGRVLFEEEANGRNQATTEAIRHG